MQEWIQLREHNKITDKFDAYADADQEAKKLLRQVLKKFRKSSAVPDTYDDVEEEHTMQQKLRNFVLLLLLDLLHQYLFLMIGRIVVLPNSEQ